MQVTLKYNARFRTKPPALCSVADGPFAKWLRAMIDGFPKAADRLTGRCDREITPDLELEYLYRQLTERVL